MDNLDLHHEIECLRSSLRDANASIARKEEEMVAAEAKFISETERLSNEMVKLKDRYDRLLSNHQHLSKLNHELEAKLLQTIENTAVEKKVMADELASTNARFLDCEAKLIRAIAERDRYKEDCAIAASLLQANPDRFLPQSSQKLSSESVSQFGASGQPRPSTTNFPMFLPTFPPIGLSSMMSLNPPTNPPLPSSAQRSEHNGVEPRSLELSPSSGYLRSNGSVVTEL